ncbi:isocitrate lyase/PEP mutase family protein [Nocardioides speluncae]|uniref:isocitrate lyase/PEP mutase family protein n=1 Tax=Nocardioides speluncae TaxID=2670337 RepID=UPI000D689693|nr:isocitrate lyase/phosphoenolpyruvate mutase family protein [Nocardioides speluncae]
MTSSQADRADLFHDLHADGTLVLANAWDVASAVIAQDAGSKAVATTSAAVAWAYGLPDGNQMSAAPVIDLAERIVRAVDVPVSVDFEGGFADDTDGLAANIRDLVATGVVGINLEDTTPDGIRPAEEQASRIAAVRAAAEEAGVRLYVNARTDIYLWGIGEEDGRYDETVRRAAAYLEAGASGIFVPGVADLAVAERLVAAIEAPVNMLVGAGSPSVKEFAEVGVRRVSAGSAAASAAYGQYRRAVDELVTAGTYAWAEQGSVDYGTLNALVEGHSSSTGS